MRARPVWREEHVRALLEIAPHGRVPDQVRARLPAGVSDAALGQRARALAALYGRQTWSLTQLADLLNAAPILARACVHLQVPALEMAVAFRRACRASAPTRMGEASAVQRLAIPGHLCEQCLDAPAVSLVPAPWGGEMGICAACGDAHHPGV